MNFEEYASELYPAALAKISAALTEATPLQQFELVVLRLMHLLEREERLLIPETRSGAAFRVLAAKACNESIGFIGCLRAGSLWAALHHVRAMLEIFASTHHLVCKASSRETRFERFAAYPDLILYQAHLRQRALLEAGTLTKTEYEAARIVSTDTLEKLSAAAKQWAKLYSRDDLLKVRYWHAPSSIETLFRELDARPNREPTFPLYEHICHAIHVSPVGHRTVGTPGIAVFGLPNDRDRVNRDINVIAMHLFECVYVWNEEFVPGSRLLHRLNTQIMLYAEARQATASS